MIPQADIVAWRQFAPWADDAMVEQDLVLSRAVVEIFSDATLAGGLALRGGTALHKLVLVPPRRYSEDIDLVQVQPGPIGDLLNGIRARLDPWLGAPTRDHAEASVTLLYRLQAMPGPSAGCLTSAITFTVGITQACPTHLAHLWSLTVEELFYVFWPLLFALLFKYGKGFRAPLIISLAVAAASRVAVFLLNRRGIDGSVAMNFAVFSGSVLKCCTMIPSVRSGRLTTSPAFHGYLTPSMIV